MSFLAVVAGVVLALAGILFVNLRGWLDVNRSINPHLHRYAVGLLALTAGLLLVVFFVPCHQLSAWTIGAATMTVTVGISLTSWSWGYRIPELRRVVIAIGVITALMIVIAVLRPTCP